MRFAAIVLCLIVFSCHHQVKQEINVPEKIVSVIDEAGDNKDELMKVVAHYQQVGDPLKLKAAFFILKYLPYQFHYEGQTVDKFKTFCRSIDSMARGGAGIDYSHLEDSFNLVLNSIEKNQLSKVKDMQSLTAELLIENIDLAFQSWKYPWAKSLSFEQFCRFILPYKLKNERPERWRIFFQKKYQWVLDSVGQNSDPQVACKLINEDLKKWFYFADLTFPFHPDFSDLLKLRTGRCPEETQIAAYAMRAMGIPVTLEYVPFWANRNSGHDWNALIKSDKNIPFLGTEVDPGLYKIEFPMPGSLRSKRAKIFRWTYESNVDKTGLLLDELPPALANDKFQDVTNKYVITKDVKVSVPEKFNEYEQAFLCVFNLGWKPIWNSKVKNGRATFTNMGTGILYLPVVDEDGSYIPIGDPFILQEDGSKKSIASSGAMLDSISLRRKYPAGDDNEVVKGNTYELFCWNNKWKSLGKQVAVADSLRFRNVPANSLLWLRNLTEGLQERIFLMEKNKQVWW